MFQTGIKPAWEDEKNKQGGEFKLDIQGLREAEVLQNLWEGIVFDIVTGNVPCVKQGITGIRLV